MQNVKCTFYYMLVLPRKAVAISNANSLLLIVLFYKLRTRWIGHIGSRDVILLKSISFFNTVLHMLICRAVGVNVFAIHLKEISGIVLRFVQVAVVVPNSILTGH